MDPKEIAKVISYNVDINEGWSDVVRAAALSGAAFLSSPGSATETPTPVQQVVRPTQPDPDMHEIMNILAQHEGYKHVAYEDTEGNMTIGIGFNLDREGADRIITNLGHDYTKVYNKQETLTDQEIQTLFKNDIKKTLRNVKHAINTYDQQPPSVKLILIDMCYNMPKIPLPKFKLAINTFNYPVAKAELIDSDFYRTTKNRGKDLADRLGRVGQ